MHGKALEIDQTEERISKLYDKNLEKIQVEEEQELS